jgi:hypothetical protein
MGTFLAWARKIYITRGKRGSGREDEEGGLAGGLLLTSLRSSFVGMLHSIDLSSRPGRRSAESIRSGRLGDDVESVVSDCYKDTTGILRHSNLVAART